MHQKNRQVSEEFCWERFHRVLGVNKKTYPEILGKGFELSGQHVKSSEVIPSILTRAATKNLDKMKISGSSQMHPRKEVTEQTTALTTGKTDRALQRSSAYREQKPTVGAKTSRNTLNWNWQTAGDSVWRSLRVKNSEGTNFKGPLPFGQFYFHEPYQILPVKWRKGPGLRQEKGKGNHSDIQAELSVLLNKTGLQGKVLYQSLINLWGLF